MANLVLIHGAWHGAWCWSKLAPLLIARGHRVSAPDLPGHGGDQTPYTRVTMKRYVRRVIEAVEAFDGKVVLIGHSMAGLVISQVAEQIPERVDRLVYVTAFLLANGENLLSTMQSEQGQSLAVATDNGAGLMVPDQIFNEFFYSDCSVEDRAWAKPQLVIQAALPFATPLAVSDECFGSVPRAYIHCDLDRVIPLAEQSGMVAALPCDSVAHIAAGHMAMVCEPELLASTIDQMVASSLQ
ncbi:MAG: alpha/beta fold hydrolase [Pseudomonadales bacterium]|nr:alpha/beta fold hydrolase [Pseudomonadales bacterium]